jgi:hypothetical protein
MTIDYKNLKRGTTFTDEYGNEWWIIEREEWKMDEGIEIWYTIRNFRLDEKNVSPTALQRDFKIQ